MNCPSDCPEDGAVIILTCRDCGRLFAELLSYHREKSEDPDHRPVCLWCDKAAEVRFLAIEDPEEWELFLQEPS